MSANDYVKFVTEQIVKYIDTPKEVRVQRKAERKNAKTPFLTKWFGILPMSLSMLMKKKR